MPRELVKNSDALLFRGQRSASERRDLGVSGASFRSKRIADASRERLLVLLETEYDLLIVRLSGALHSPDAAVEALHDAYLKLKSCAAVGEIRNPRSYLYRMAINLAKNRRRHEMLFPHADAVAVVDLTDDAPDPERAVSARLALARVLDALETLPAQRRDIFLAAWRDEKTQSDIAAQFGLHKRTVQKELARAERYLRTALCSERSR